MTPVTPVTLLLVCLGAALGAPARYLVDRSVQALHGGAFPWGTLVVNVAGSFVLGVLLGVDRRAAVAPEVLAAVGVGFCGAFTTYSTFAYETVQLAAAGSRLPAALNALLAVAAGLGAAVLGTAVGAAG